MSFSEPFLERVLYDLVECLLCDSTERENICKRYAVYERMLRKSAEELKGSIGNLKPHPNISKNFATEMLTKLGVVSQRRMDGRSNLHNGMEPPLEPMEDIRSSSILARSPALDGSVQFHSTYGPNVDQVDDASPKAHPETEPRPISNGRGAKRVTLSSNQRCEARVNSREMKNIARFVEAAGTCANILAEIFNEEDETSYYRAHAIIRTLLEEQIKSFGQLNLGVFAFDHMMTAFGQKFFEGYHKEVGIPKPGSLKLLGETFELSTLEIQRWFQIHRNRLIILEPYLIPYRHERSMGTRTAYLTERSCVVKP